MSFSRAPTPCITQLRVAPSTIVFPAAHRPLACILQVLALLGLLVFKCNRAHFLKYSAVVNFVEGRTP